MKCRQFKKVFDCNVNEVELTGDDPEIIENLAVIGYFRLLTGHRSLQVQLKF